MGVAEALLNSGDESRRYTWIETGTVASVPTDKTGRVVVNLSGGQIEIDTSVPVRPGDLVRVLRSQSTQPQLIGRANTGPWTGTITAVSAGVSVDVKGTQDQIVYKGIPYITSYSPTVGDGVAIDWDRVLVMGKLSSAAGVGDPTVVPPPPPTPTSGTTAFSAQGSGSYQSGRWWTPKVYYSQSNLGAWWYGTKIRDTLAGATAQPGCLIYLPVESASGANYAQLGVHPHPSQPAGAPSISGLRQIAGSTVSQSGWYPLDTDIAQTLINNAGWGIGTAGPGYRIFSAVQGGNPDSGKLLINWKR